MFCHEPVQGSSSGTVVGSAVGAGQSGPRRRVFLQIRWVEYHGMVIGIHKYP